MVAEVVLPAALPSIITGFRVGAGFAFRGLIFAEMLAAKTGVGYLILLSESLMLLPGGGVFLDVWRVDAAPREVVENRTHLRVGVGVDLDLLLSITPAFFTRVGVGGRGGFDSGGPFFSGASLSLGVGLFL